MYAYLNGAIDSCTPTHLVLDVNGIGFEMRVSLATYSALNGQTSAKVYTHLRVQEDAHTLYGFHSPDEKDIFVDVTSVSGVGPSTAMVMLSSATPAELRSWIAGSNFAALTKLKGVGQKTAQQICLALAEKMQKRGVAPDVAVAPVAAANSQVKEDAIAALLTLGLTKKAATDAVTAVLAKTPDAPLEGIIKNSLNR